MNRLSILSYLLLIPMLSCSSVPILIQSEEPAAGDKPQLVVGITVDQMRYDYLVRFWDDFTERGFKRMVNEGFLFRNHHFSYAPTFTGPGHASIFTGTTPSIHGIIANDWFERSSRKMVYCSSDTTVHGVGGSGYVGQMSPARLRSSTLGDELKLFTNNRSKVIGISMKDRGAILPAGHNPNGAYWFDGGVNGKWMTSSFYMEALPNWVTKFNEKGLPEKYLSQGWDLMLAKESYDESSSDNNPYESPFKGSLKPVFPYDLESMRALNGNYDLIKATPHGNSLSVDFAIEAIKSEGLGADEHTDLLALSFSSTDYVGHQFGPHAMETQDVYLRLDRDLERLLDFLDQEVGSGNYLIFLTADHGGAPVPSLVKDKGWPNDYFNSAPMISSIDSYLKLKYGLEGLILSYSNEQIFLDEDRILEAGLNIHQLELEICVLAEKSPGVVTALSSNQVLTGNFQDHPLANIQAGFRSNMSGNICLLLEPGWMEYGRTGTTHGMPYSYDTHVPLIFFGAGIPQGDSHQPSRIRDIAPTVSALLQIPFTSGCTGSPLLEIVENK